MTWDVAGTGCNCDGCEGSGAGGQLRYKRMMEKIKNIIKHNTILKLISLVIGFVIWALAYNVSNPEVTETVTCILNVRNEDELTSIDKTYSIDTSIVRITYKVRSQDKRKVSTSEFEAYVDLSDY